MRAHSLISYSISYFSIYQRILLLSLTGINTTTQDGGDGMSNEQQQPTTEYDKLLVITVVTGKSGYQNPRQPFVRATLYSFPGRSAWEHDGARRFLQSARHYGHTVHVIDGYSHEYGMGPASPGAPVDKSWKWYEAKFGTKLTLLRESRLSEVVRRTGATVILFVDAFDVIIDADAETILARFFEHFAHSKHFNRARIVFSVEPSFISYPLYTLSALFPPIKSPARFLNSGLFIGYAEDLLRLWKEFLPQASKEDDDQGFYTQLYVQREVRERYEIGLYLDSFLMQTYTIPSVTLVPDSDMLLPVQFEEDTGRAYVSPLN
jgi:hypothetical protein